MRILCELALAVTALLTPAGGNERIRHSSSLVEPITDGGYAKRRIKRLLDRWFEVRTFTSIDCEHYQRSDNIAIRSPGRLWLYGVMTAISWSFSRGSNWLAGRPAGWLAGLLTANWRRRAGAATLLLRSWTTLNCWQKHATLKRTIQNCCQRFVCLGIIRRRAIHTVSAVTVAICVHVCVMAFGGTGKHDPGWYKKPDITYITPQVVDYCVRY